jgi:hypothetical protein
MCFELAVCNTLEKLKFNCKLFQGISKSINREDLQQQAGRPGIAELAIFLSYLYAKSQREKFVQ